MRKEKGSAKPGEYKGGGEKKQEARKQKSSVERIQIFFLALPNEE